MLDGPVEPGEPSSSSVWDCHCGGIVLRGPLALEGVDSQNETILPVSFYENPVTVVVKRLLAGRMVSGSHWWMVICRPVGQGCHWSVILYR